MSKNTELQPMVELWKKNNLTSCEMTFSCGGDSMNDYEFLFYSNREEISNSDTEELKDYFDNEVFNKVNFYEVSDGHYMGESGTVFIELEEDGEETEFTYRKEAESEWEEVETETTEVELTDEEVKFIKEYVSNINGGDGGVTTLFKRDMILTNEQETLVSEIEKKLDETAMDLDVDADGEWTDWYSFTTDIETNEPTIEGNNLSISVDKRFIVFRDSED